ncbi:hypothetical protein ACF3MZ_29295 [Paenibacillaceae bacterium WGS1546]|uniref:hypothetical protein n=1 Tax=Cohnella sp. WGS1546 TaxID=3366810 RepID=UPI00372CF5F9
MKEAIKTDLDGLYIEPVIVPLSRTGITEIRELLPVEENEEHQEVITGYIIAEKVPQGLFKPRWDFSLWEAYQQELVESKRLYEQVYAEWASLDEEERGEQPVYAAPERPECWVEGLTQEEIDELRNAPQPKTIEQESVETMLGLAEAYEVILDQQRIIEDLYHRVEALENPSGRVSTLWRKFTQI